MSETMEKTIVVGVDGSEHASRALAWAIEEATLRQAPIRIVTAWHVPPMAYGSTGFVVMPGPIDKSIRDVAEKAAAEAADSVRAAGLEVETSVAQGQAADALIEASEQAGLLVVGSRGHGGFVGLLLGSVSAQCGHHAKCPLVIIR